MPFMLYNDLFSNIFYSIQLSIDDETFRHVPVVESTNLQGRFDFDLIHLLKRKVWRILIHFLLSDF